MVNSQDEMAGNSVSGSSWCGFDLLRLSDADTEVLVTIGSSDRWDKNHLRRLRQSADLPGLVPVIDSDFASDGKPYAVTPVVEAPTLADRIPPSGSEWEECATITEAAARATHEAHLRGLFHGALSPDQIYVIDDDVAVSGIGLGLGGTPSADYATWVAPEVLDGSDATERSDVYSLGRILEASLGGSLEDVPRSIRRLIMWSSSDTPEARPPSALEFASILAEALGEDRRTYSPAFIPTADATDLASSASEAVAGFVPSESPAQSEGADAAGAAAAGAAAMAGGAAIGASMLGGDEPVTDVEETSAQTPADADTAAEPGADADTGVDTGTDTDIDTEAGITQEVPAGSVEGVAASGADAEGAEAADVNGEETAESDQGSVFDSRVYSEDTAAAGDEDDEEADVGYAVPAAAQTVDLDETFESDRRGNKAGILVGAILAAGLGVVAFQLLSSDDTSEVAGDGVDTVIDDEGEDAGDAVASPTTEEADAVDEEAATTVETTATTAETTTEETTATTAETTATTAETTATTAETTATTAETTTSTVAEEPDEVAAPAATVDGPIPADEAGVQVLHGIPGVVVDVYVDGEALAPGFTVGTIAGPAELPPGEYDIDIYAASDAPPPSAADRSDEPIISLTATIGAEPTTLVAHLDGEGNPTISAFVENLDSLDPATGRIELRHLAAAPAVQATIDGEDVNGLLEPGGTTAVVLDAGEHTIETSTADGTPVRTATINLADGELASVSIIGVAAEDTIEVVVQRYTGLSTAPAAVPTGDSNLLADGEDPTGLYILGAIASLMAVAGGLMMIRRSRRVL